MAPTAEIPRTVAASPPHQLSDRRTGAETPIETREPPPLLARSFFRRRAGDSAEDSTAAAVSKDRRHKIADGDTLAKLAEHYLGRASRAVDILEANRNVLTDPEILPIGVELTIPSGQAAPASCNRVLVSAAPLVPVQPTDAPSIRRSSRP